MNNEINLKFNKKIKCFSLLNFKFFNLHYDEIDTQKKKFIIIFKKKVIYKDIHMFVKKVKSYKIIIKKTLCKNFNSYL